MAKSIFAATLLTKDEARRSAANIAKLPERPAAKTYTHIANGQIASAADDERRFFLSGSGSSAIIKTKEPRHWAVNRASNDVSSATTLGGSGLGLIGGSASWGLVGGSDMRVGSA
jgi:hypothetical protein